MQSQRESAATRAKAHFNRALIFEGLGRSDQALADYNEAVKLDPIGRAAAVGGATARSAGRDGVCACCDEPARSSGDAEPSLLRCRHAA